MRPAGGAIRPLGGAWGAADGPAFAEAAGDGVWTVFAAGFGTGFGAGAGGGSSGVRVGIVGLAGDLVEAGLVGVADLVEVADGAAGRKVVPAGSADAPDDRFDVEGELGVDGEAEVEGGVEVEVDADAEADAADAEAEGEGEGEGAELSADGCPSTPDVAPTEPAEPAEAAEVPAVVPAEAAGGFWVDSRAPPSRLEPLGLADSRPAGRTGSR